MKLTDLDNKSNSASAKALEQTYSFSFPTERMGVQQVQSMLRKVTGLMAESKQQVDFYQKQTSPAYMKLVFMEQALRDRYQELLSVKPRIVFENEEVEKSQVVLAAQDMVDSVQKMLEDVGQMQVKELPALVSSIESEIGVNESQTYNEQVTAQLDTLSAALKEAFNGLKAALGTVTGQGGGFEASGDMAAAPAGGEEVDISADEETPAGDEQEDISVEEPPEEAPVAGAGRTLR